MGNCVAEKPAKRHKTGFRGPSPDVGKATQFKPGQSGNPDGKPKTKPITDLFRALFDDEYETRLDEFRKVLSGKSAMAKVILLKDAAERLEGKVSQKYEVDGTLAISLADAIQKARKRAQQK